MTRRKPLSKRLTALSLARNLTSKQEHQVIAMADRARHLEVELAALRTREERLREVATAEGPDVSCGGYGVTSTGCFAGNLAHKVLLILEGRSEFEQELIDAMSKPIGTPAEQAVTNLRTHLAIEEMGRRLRDQEEEPS